MLELLADPQTAYPIIHIAGTNGKGSTARIVAELPSTHGLKPVVDSTFELEHAADAFRRLEHGQHFGKIVIKI